MLLSAFSVPSFKHKRGKVCRQSYMAASTTNMLSMLAVAVFIFTKWLNFHVKQ